MGALTEISGSLGYLTPDVSLTMGWTPLVVLIGIIALAIYDLIMVLRYGTPSSVSQFLITTAFKSPLVSFGFGAVVGHLFLYMYPMGCQPDTLSRMLDFACMLIFYEALWYLANRIFGWGNK